MSWSTHKTASPPFSLSKKCLRIGQSKDMIIFDSVQWLVLVAHLVCSVCPLETYDHCKVLRTWFCNLTYGKQLQLSQTFYGGTSFHAIIFVSNV